MFAEPLVTESVESLRSTVGSCAASTTQDRSRACFASPVLLEDDDLRVIVLAKVVCEGGPDDPCADYTYLFQNNFTFEFSMDNLFHC